MGTYLHVLSSFHPCNGVEAELGVRVLPPSWVSQGVLKIQEQMVKESRGKIKVLYELSCIPFTLPRETLKGCKAQAKDNLELLSSSVIQRCAGT